MVEETEKEVVSIKGFACSCGDDGKAKMKELHDWAVKYIHKDREQKYPDLLTTQILYALTEYYVWIEGVPLDPGGWGAIAAESSRRAGDEAKFFIQFDRFEDGLYLLLQKVVNHFGEPKMIEDDEEDDNE